jgi:KDO2-lipid IV(A) lauroyltransferase
LGTICNREAASRLEIVRRGDAEVFRKGGGPAVFVTAHLANWEVAAGAVAWQGIPLTGIYTPIQNPEINDMLYRAREELNCGMVKREGAVRQLIKALKKGVSVGLIVDQRVDSGEPVPFFGHNMKTSITPAQLALRSRCALIPVQVQRLRAARFRVIFHEAVQPDDTSASERKKTLQMTRKVNALFESWIRERPHEWMCTKRRWPKDLQLPVRAQKDIMTR